MIYQVRLIEPTVALALAQEVEQIEGWVDGRNTAGAHIRERKQNEQLTTAPAELKMRVARVLGSSAVVERVGPAIITEPRFSRYHVGDHYDWHVDAGLDGGLPCDISMSLVLRGAVGGKIQIRVGDVVVSLDPKPGEAAFWASHLEHRIAPVEDGVRVVAIAGVQTMIRDVVAREIYTRLGRLSPKIPPEGRDDFAFAFTNVLRLHRR